MIYLLDANVLIVASRTYYRLNKVPEFWDWLIHHGNEGHVKIPIEIYEEVKAGNDDLADWIKLEKVKEALLLDEEVEVSVVSHVVETGYAPDLTDDEIEKIGRDPFLVAHALHNSEERCVVTTEVSRPRRERANRHLPDVCRDLGITTYNTFEFSHELDFSTSWNES